MFLIMFFFTLVLAYTAYCLLILKKVYNSHELAHTAKYINDGRFNEAFNILQSSESQEKCLFLKPIVDLVDKNIRTIVFMNNVNSIIYGEDKRLLFELSLASKDKTKYYFITDNYNVNENQNLVSNIINNNFPKLFDNDANYYNYIDLKKLGYEFEGKIKADNIIAIVFNGKNKEMILIMNDIEQTSFFIKYKSKQEMIALIKQTNLYKYIMQWGVAGFADSMLTYVDNNIQKESVANAGSH